jgi:uncharacterized membrane protein YdjX (TVP38/TMEM64 family)
MIDRSMERVQPSEGEEAKVADNRTGSGTGNGPGLRRALPLALLVGAGLALWFGLDVGAYLSFEALGRHHAELQDTVAGHPWLSAIGFAALYALVIAFSLPLGSILTVIGGFLFGTVAATGFIVVGATVGAVAVFLAARTALHDYLRAKVGRRLQRMEAGFKENALSYMLVLRLIPLFPFWLVNLVPAFLGVSLGTYTLATLLGIIPGTFIYASLGNGLGKLLEAGETPSLDIVFDIEVLTPIIGLALISLLPVAYKKWRARRP